MDTQQARERLGRAPSTVSVQQAAEILGDVQDRTVRLWIRRGWIEAYRVGRQLRITGKEINRILLVRERESKHAQQNGKSPLPLFGVTLHNNTHHR